MKVLLPVRAIFFLTRSKFSNLLEAYIQNHSKPNVPEESPRVCPIRRASYKAMEQASLPILPISCVLGRKT